MRLLKLRRLAVLLILAGILVGLGVYLSIRPSNDRAWTADQAVLPWAEIDGREIRVHNIRNATYRTTGDFDAAWYDKTFDLDRLESLWFIVEPFAGWDGLAHTFVSFGFAGGDYLAVSVEIRKEQGEQFSPWKGLLRQYELMYVLGDERDLVRLRSNFRNDDVYVYPIRAPREGIERMLLGMLERTNRLRERPEHYNSLTSTCTTNIVRHVNQIEPGRIPYRYEVFLPGFSDRLAYELGLIDTALPFEQARARFKINERARRWADSPDFSTRIRQPV